MKCKRVMWKLSDAQLLDLHERVRASLTTYRDIAMSYGTTATDVRQGIRGALGRRMPGAEVAA